jgi:hypothetical protein
MQQRHMRLDRVDRCTGTTGVLNGQRVKPVGARSAKMRLHPRDLHDFTAQTDKYGRAHILMDRMPHSTRSRISNPRPLLAMPQPVPWARATTPSTLA